MANDGFQLVDGKRQARASVRCTKPGCTGSCPVNVVRRSNQPDGVPAKCLLCERRYKVPPGVDAAPKQHAKTKGSWSEAGFHKELLALKKELEALKGAKDARESPPSRSLAKNELASPDNVPMPADDRAAVKALQLQIQQLKELTPELRNSLCEAKGGYEAFSACLEMQRQQIFAKHRGSMPIGLQKQKSQLHLDFVQKRRDQAQSALDSLQTQQEELADKIAQQQQTLADAEVKLQAAKIEAATIAQAAALQATVDVGPAQTAQPVAVSAITAQAVKGFFRSLPTTVAEHPEGVQAVEQIMALLDKLDSAAALAQASTPPALVGHRPPGTAGAVAAMVADGAAEDGAMELDDDLLTHLAEAAVPEGGSAEDRPSQVAEAKARLSKVRKISKSRS